MRMSNRDGLERYEDLGRIVGQRLAEWDANGERCAELMFTYVLTGPTVAKEGLTWHALKRRSEKAWRFGSAWNSDIVDDDTSSAAENGQDNPIIGGTARLQVDMIPPRI